MKLLTEQIINEALLEKLPEEFSTHEFILFLAQKYQVDYIQALNECSSNDTPFNNLHKRIGKYLSSINLVTYIGDTTDNDIFGRESKNALWKKYSK